MSGNSYKEGNSDRRTVSEKLDGIDKKFQTHTDQASSLFESLPFDFTEKHDRCTRLSREIWNHIIVPVNRLVFKDQVEESVWSHRNKLVCQAEALMLKLDIQAGPLKGWESEKSSSPE